MKEELRTTMNHQINIYINNIFETLRKVFFLDHWYIYSLELCAMVGDVWCLVLAVRFN